MLSQILSFLSSFLAPFIDKFKASSPTVYAIIALFLSVAIYTINQGNFLSVWDLDAAWKQVLEVLAWLSALLLGSRTTSFLPKQLPKIPTNVRK